MTSILFVIEKGNGGQRERGAPVPLMKTFFINGKKVFSGSVKGSLVINGSEVLVDGKPISDVSTLPDKEITIRIEGDVTGDVNTEGTVVVEGGVGGSVRTVGNVSCGTVQEDVKTTGPVMVNGDVHGSVRTIGGVTAKSIGSIS